MRYSNDPERVAFDLTDVNASIRRQIKAKEYPDDEPLKLLQAANTACVTYICETHPEVDAELQRGLEVEPQALPEEDVLLLQTAWQVSRDMLDEDAAMTTLEDEAEILAGKIIDARTDPMPEWSSEAHALRSIVVRRQISRLWQLSCALLSVEGLAELYDSRHSKALGYLGRVGGGATALLAAVALLGSLIGI